MSTKMESGSILRPPTSAKDENGLSPISDYTYFKLSNNENDAGQNNRMEILKRLPRLAFIGDVAPARTASGSLLLYRLLKEYPLERLLVIVNNDQMPSKQELRLPGVDYLHFPYSMPRVIRNRFNPAWPILQANFMRYYTRAMAQVLRPFSPEAILTVPHSYLWFTAACVARRLNIPLHLIVHDDWPNYMTARRTGRFWDAVRWGCRCCMRPIYRQAASRLCVSPGMEESCMKWFSKPGTVVYPTWGDDSPTGKVRVRTRKDEPPVVAFSGMIHQDGTAGLLRKVAEIMSQLNGYLDLYTPMSAESLAGLGLVHSAVRLQGFFSASEMGERVGRTASALLLLASFEPREREDVATLFPSKLADYTLIGLPIVVWGPDYSSAGRWAAENENGCVRVTDPSIDSVKDAIRGLIADPASASRIAAIGIEAGNRYFNVHIARNTFYSALTAT